MRRVLYLVILAVLCYGAFLLWQNNGDMMSYIKPYVELGDIATLEARYTAGQIMEANKNKLRMDEQHRLQEPYLRFYPYLLMDVKYSLQGDKTREGVLLWGMVDGEIVLNSDTWETSHGFQDAIESGASREDFKVLFALDANGGALSREELQRRLQVESDVMEYWLSSAKQKHLVIQKGNQFYLHFEQPKLNVIPQTKLKQALVTKPSGQAVRIPKRYSVSQIEKIAKVAFGNEFTIRGAREVFLPVYSLDILNPDGSLLSTQWNALNGRRLETKY